MTTETTNGTASGIPRRRTDEILAALAERLGATFTAASVSARRSSVRAVTRGSRSPRSASGSAAAAENADSAQSGEGGGGGGLGGPAGYIEIEDGQSRFVPIVNPARLAAIGSGVMLAAALALRVARGART